MPLYELIEQPDLDDPVLVLAAEALSYRATGERVGVLPEEELAAQLTAFSDLALREGLAIEA